MLQTEPFYGRFTAEVREIPRCSAGGHSAREIAPCDGAKCDVYVCEKHLFTCGDCGRVYCGQCWQETDSGLCIGCDERPVAV